MTDKEPKELIYPEGWFYDCGLFRTYWKDENCSVEFYTRKGVPWKNIADYKAF